MTLNRGSQPEICEVDKIDIPRPVQHILPNGTPLYVIHAGEQEVVRMDMIFNAGTWHQSQKLQALFAHRMLREGSSKYTSSEIENKLDYYGASLELSNSLENTYLTLYSLNKYFSETLDIIESIVKEPTFPEKELHTIVGTNLQQYLINRSKVDFIAHHSMMGAMFGPQHPSGQLAKEEDYQHITPQILCAFYQQFYYTGNYAIFLSGNVTDEIIHQVERAFGTDTFGKIPPATTKPVYPITTTPEKRIFTAQEEAMQSAVKLSDFTITRSHPDYFKLRILITLMGGYFGSRLMSNIREDKGYTYGISMGIVQYPHTGLMVISTETGNEYVEPLIKEVYNEIDRLQQELVGVDELTIVKNYMLGEMCRSFESPFSLADAWTFIYTAKLNNTYYTQSLETIKNVTAEELRELSRSYICKESLKEVIAGKKIL